MTTISRTDLQKQIAAIPTGTRVRVEAFASWVERVNDKLINHEYPFTVTGEIYEHPYDAGVNRKVGDTPIEFRDPDGVVKPYSGFGIRSITVLDDFQHERRQSSSVALSGLQQAVTDAGMDLK